MNERLKEYLGFKPTSVTNENELIYGSTRYFDTLVDFLREERKFPNREINNLTTLLWRLIGNKHIPMTLDTSGSVSNLSMLVLGKSGEEIPFFIMPKNFIVRVNENPAMQLGAVVYNASQARDYWTGKLVLEKKLGFNNNFHKRAIAFEAEMLITLKKVSSGVSQELELNDYQTAVLRNYPEGLKSLDPSLRYQTPPYKTIGQG